MRLTHFVFCSSCRKKCFTSISSENMTEIFKRLYTLESKNQQDVFLQGLIEASDVKKRRPRKGDQARINSKYFEYYVMIGDVRRKVCLIAFLSLYAISRKRVERLRNLLIHGQSPNDRRGKHPAANAISGETRSLIIDHIQSFPVKESHYSNREYKYLNERLNVKILHSMFLMKHPKLKVGYDYFLRFFHENFDLSFGRPQVDTCCTCEEIKIKLKNQNLNDAAKRVAAAELAVHKRKAGAFYRNLKAETGNVATHDGVLSLCIDYMQNISLPCIPVQEIFYLRQLTVNLFCIHNIKENTACFYVYHQGEARKGPNEVCSFLFDYLKDKENKFSEIHLYSDNCAAQNKNHALSRFLLALTDSEKFKKIECYYPIVGHSYLPCDRDFSMVKRILKKHDRYYSVHDITAMICESSTENKFQVIEIEGDDILEFKNWWKTYYKKSCVSMETFGRKIPKDQKEHFSISKYKQFTYDSKKKGIIVARPYINSMITHTFRMYHSSKPDIQLPGKKAYNNKIPIKNNTVTDIMKCYNYIPQEFKEFYNEILKWPTAENDFNTDESDQD